MKMETKNIFQLQTNFPYNPYTSYNFVDKVKMTTKTLYPQMNKSFITIKLHRVIRNDSNPRSQIYLTHKQHISRINLCG